MKRPLKGPLVTSSLDCYIKTILTLSGLSLATKPWRSFLFLSCDAMLRPRTHDYLTQRCEKADQVGIDTWYQSTCAIFEVVSCSEVMGTQSIDSMTAHSGG